MSFLLLIMTIKVSIFACLIAYCFVDLFFRSLQLGLDLCISD